MRVNAAQTAPLGELVVAVFDEAAKHTSDPGEISRLATGAVLRLLRHVWKKPPGFPLRRGIPARPRPTPGAFPRWPPRG